MRIEMECSEPNSDPVELEKDNITTDPLYISI